MLRLGELLLVLGGDGLAEVVFAVHYVWEAFVGDVEHVDE